MKEYQDNSNYILYDIQKNRIIEFYNTRFEAEMALEYLGNPVDVEVRPCHKFYSSFPSG